MFNNSYTTGCTVHNTERYGSNNAARSFFSFAIPNGLIRGQLAAVRIDELRQPLATEQFRLILEIAPNLK